MTTKTIRDVEIFATGQWNGREYDRADLDALVDSFAALTLADRLPVKLGHEARDTEPAQGWISELRREGDKLLATLTQVPAELVDDIREGRWRHVSVEMLADVVANGREYPWVLSALAILGSARPAVDVLKPLHQVVARALPAGVRFRERMAFSRSPDEAEVLRAEVKRLNQVLVANEFDAAIRDGRILPRDRYAFETRMGADATLEDARKWIGGSPRPAPLNRARAPVGGSDHSTIPQDETADVELVRLTRAEIERSNGKLSYMAANLVVLKSNPELANRYRFQPGEKD